MVSELLKRGATVDAATKKGNTALHIASLGKQAPGEKNGFTHAKMGSSVALFSPGRHGKRRCQGICPPGTRGAVQPGGGSIINAQGHDAQLLCGRGEKKNGRP